MLQKYLVEYGDLPRACISFLGVVIQLFGVVVAYILICSDNAADDPCSPGRPDGCRPPSRSGYGSMP